MARHRESTLWRTQNFLRDRALMERLVSRVGIAPTDVVYDLGAGSGVLTDALARRAGRVIAVEKDPALVARLTARFRDRPNVEIRHADILAHPLPRTEYVVFASPPFDITSAIMRKLATADVPPRAAYLALQREAVDRYLGRPRQTLAALLLAPWFSLRIVHHFARSDFAPPPAVDVVMVRMQKRGPPLIAPGDAQAYRDFVVALFVSRRPSIGAASTQLFGGRVSRRLLHAAQIDPASSPSALALPAWLRLFGHFARLPAQIRNSVAGAEKRLRRRQQGLQKIHRTRAPRDALSVRSVALRLPSRWLHPERSLTQNPRDVSRPCPGPLLLTGGTYRRPPREARQGDGHLEMGANR
jgi:23S rRNA (adenine-N6)-dimethyltransferase